ncbi:MAG: hypothetical protein ACP5XB_09120 [Isosphaeraceae bacterium]
MTNHPRRIASDPVRDYPDNQAHRDHLPSLAPINDETLRKYLVDALPPEELARVEKALRDSAQLRERLEDVRHHREDVHLHTLGAIWHRCRLTCASRQQLGSYLLDALDPDLASYIKFHIEVVECPYCRANLADLERRQAGHPSASTAARGKRFLEATRDLLGEEGNRTF